MCIFSEQQLVKLKHKIPYCVWDIGQVVYHYTLEPFNEWCVKNSNTLERSIDELQPLDFNPYMAGNITFNEFCHKVCTHYNIPYDANTTGAIQSALRQGQKETHSITIELMKIFKNAGIVNCVLSNALPCLKGISAPFFDYVEPENRFYSFDIHALKPNEEAYRLIKEKLQCEYDDILFIDDKIRNVSTARELGINGIVFSPESIISELALFIA